MRRTTIPTLVARLRREAFTPRRRGARRVGAEVELLAVDAGTHRVCPIAPDPDGSSPPATLPLVRRLAAREGWAERPSPYGAPVFDAPDGGLVSFEPGGQIEYSAPPSTSLSAVVARLQGTVRALRATLGDAGIELLAVGLDPYNPIDRVRLQLRGARYLAMDAYLATRGRAGRRMMRQTASFQVTLDAGDDPVGVWRVLSAAAPYVTAIFANSTRYAGAPTGLRSARAETWRDLDPARTGLPGATAADPASAYAAFALAAPAILLPARDGAWRPFGELLLAGHATSADWAPHLTTLFPEVRPRRMGGVATFEARSADAIPAEWYAAPLVLLAGLTYDRRARCEAATLLGPADPTLLGRAARAGLREPELRAVAGDLFDLAVRGATRLGEQVVGGLELEVTREFVSRYTRRGRSPADDGEPATTEAGVRLAGEVHAGALA